MTSLRHDIGMTDKAGNRRSFLAVPVGSELAP
jgi:hypothetical protein